MRFLFSYFCGVCERCLTKKAEPPPTRDVNRDRGTDSANGGWLRRLVRPHHRPTISLLCWLSGMCHKWKKPPKGLGQTWRQPRDHTYTHKLWRKRSRSASSPPWPSQCRHEL